MTTLSKTTPTATMELFRASNYEVGDQEDYTNEDIVALISTFVASDYAIDRLNIEDF